jgi:hypothetical protein
MVNDNYLVLFSFLCCPLDAGFRLWENAVGELELLSVQKFPHRKWRKPCISTFKRTQQNISQRWSHVRLYDGPLHEYLLPGGAPIVRILRITKYIRIYLECLSQGGRARTDFSLAWLEAAWYFSEGGHGPTRRRSVQKMLHGMCITVLPQYWIPEYF